MTFEKGRVYATIQVGETDYTRTLFDCAPPEPQADVGETRAGRVMPYPLALQYQAMEFTFQVEGDYEELAEPLDKQFSYEEYLQTPGADDELVEYEIGTSGKTVRTVRESYNPRNNGLPGITHTYRVLKYRKTVAGVLTWDIDITVYPPKAQYKGVDQFPTRAAAAAAAG